MKTSSSTLGQSNVYQKHTLVLHGLSPNRPFKYPRAAETEEAFKKRRNINQPKKK